MIKSTVSTSANSYEKTLTKKRAVLFILSIILVILLIATTVMGTASIGPVKVFKIIILSLFNKTSEGVNNIVIMNVRLPRVLCAAIVGASLAGCGAVMQGVLKNPLVSEYTLGLSSGAAFGAGIAIVIGDKLFKTSFMLVDKYAEVGCAFIFGMLTMIVVYFIARIKRTSSSTLILAGVAMSYLFSALLALLQYASNDEQLRDIIFWLMGGFWLSNWKAVFILLPITLICLIFMMKYAWDLNVLGSGEEIATSLGINVERVQFICLLICAFAASSCVAFTGIIGFIGLVAPHISRMIIGSDHRFLIPCSALMGSIILLAADTLSRTVISPTELPISIITSFIGVPFFIYLLLKGRRCYWK